MAEHLNKILFIGGKGGVGKSTSAAAVAWKLAKENKKTLLISTDPAHNLGDIFSQKIGGETQKITDNLYALEIDPETETTKYINSVKENVKGTVQSSMIDEVNRQLDTAKASPGADESALFDKLISIIIEEEPAYDHLVFDTAPTGHTIRLLTLPELMGVWIEGLLKKRRKTNENYTQLLNDGEPVEDPIYEVLLERQNRFKQAREILLESDKTGFIFVLNPERLPILETKKAIDLLDQYHLHVNTVFVNKVLPAEVDGSFLAQRRRHEKQYLQDIEETFPNQRKIHIPLLPHDITTLEELDAFSGHYQL
ncbi:ArsA family ATPase [Lacicoccus qingdaonensis]|uniref:Arsenite efflux ATP-binding protein ArsA n=1 Tax=Lacicoccus qingdaonensis TaxID=576118 RepID=A0A1G9AXL9_9BACL|nr:ArsA family ATPase [Salinicoccus qingdaonensis]SDK31355.1 arsenite efflux ATP-binding protein ArsA [Salinicoccus qingdaonensis]